MLSCAFTAYPDDGGKVNNDIGIHNKYTPKYLVLVRNHGTIRVNEEYHNYLNTCVRVGGSEAVFFALCGSPFFAFFGPVLLNGLTFLQVGRLSHSACTLSGRWD